MCGIINARITQCLFNTLLDSNEQVIITFDA